MTTHQTDLPAMYRHGDVLLIWRGAAPSPENPEPLPTAETVVAEGELTGHAHRVSGEGLGFAPLTISMRGRQADITALALPRGGRIVHEEHRRIDLPPGMYEVRIQQTLTQQGRWVNVAD